MKTNAILTIVVIAAISASAAADDVPSLRPSWRGGPNTITAAWDLFAPTGLGPGSQSLLGNMVTANPPLSPTSIVAQASWNSSCWVYQTYMGRQGVIEVNPGGGIAPVGFALVNYDNDNPLKRIRIQITQLGSGVLDFYIGAIPAPPGEPWPIPDPMGLTKVDAVVVDAYQHDDEWVTRAYDLQITPNPAFEYIGLDWGYAWQGAAWIDQVVIDTQCIPEPATMCLLLAAGLPLLKRKRS